MASLKQSKPASPKRRVTRKAHDRITDALRAHNADDIRNTGWSVAVHNDYTLNGERFTFWLFTKGDRCVKGEGETDAAALDSVREQLGMHKYSRPEKPKVQP